MHYLVDAYNFLFKISKNCSPLEKSRQSFIEELHEIVAELGLHVTLVFDGAEEHLPFPRRGHYHAIEIVYTPKDQTADEYIYDLITFCRSPAQFTVVTNDRELSSRCHQHRAKTMTIHQFLNFLSKKKVKKNRLKDSREQAFRDSDREIARLLLIFKNRML